MQHEHRCKYLIGRSCRALKEKTNQIAPAYHIHRIIGCGKLWGEGLLTHKSIVSMHLKNVNNTLWNMDGVYEVWQSKYYIEREREWLHSSHPFNIKTWPLIGLWLIYPQWLGLRLIMIFKTMSGVKTTSRRSNLRTTYYFKASIEIHLYVIILSLFILRGWNQHEVLRVWYYESQNLS